MSLLENFTDLQKLAESESRGDLVLVPTLIKEILHYDLLHAIGTTPELARSLVFHGGTALRLCHSSTRFSEDLDFCCGNEETFEKLDTLAGERFAKIMHDRYGLKTRWDQKKPLSFPGEIEVRRWQARIMIPLQGSRTGMEHVHRINVEVSRVPSFDNAPMRVKCHYPHLKPAFRELLIRSSTREEILVDKILAMTNRETIKNRDIWDIDMLLQAETELRPDLFAKRFVAPAASNWQERLNARIEQIRTLEHIKLAAEELARFVRKEERERLEHLSGQHTQRLVERVAGFLSRVVRDRGQVPMIGHRTAEPGQGGSAHSLQLGSL